MLHRIIQSFFIYCRFADFPRRYLQPLAIRLKDLAEFLKFQSIRSFQMVA